MLKEGDLVYVRKMATVYTVTWCFSEQCPAVWQSDIQLPCGLQRINCTSNQQEFKASNTKTDSDAK